MIKFFLGSSVDMVEGKSFYYQNPAVCVAKCRSYPHVLPDLVTFSTLQPSVRHVI